MSNKSDNSSETIKEEEEESWWSLTTSIAQSIKEQIPSQTKNACLGLADVIHRSANAVVAEFAQMEIEAEREARRWRRERGYYSDDEEEECMKNALPWEVCTEVDEELKSKILALSCQDTTFYTPFEQNTSEEEDFDLDSHVSLIRKLLSLDSNLADKHARLSGSKIKERVFWHNYFYHCLKTQIGHRSEENNIVQKLSEDDDIVNIPSPPRSARSIGDLVIVGDTAGTLDNDFTT